MRNFFVKFLRYFLTGGLAAIVDAGGFALLHENDIPTLEAAIFSFSVAAVFNFMLTTNYVFRQRPSWKRFSLFLTAALFGLTVNVSITMLSISFLIIDPRLAKIVGIGFAFTINFLMNLFIVFRNKEIIP